MKKTGRHICVLGILVALISGCDEDEPVAKEAAITSFSPSSGTPGTVVTIVGENFSETNSNVFFYGQVEAMVISSTKTEVVVIVPALANSGAITVTSETGDRISEHDFVVLPQWTEIAPLPSFERAFAFAFSIGSKGYVGSGYESGKKHHDFWEYRTEQNTWTQKADFPGTGTSSAAAVSIGEKGYVGGGVINTLSLSKEFWTYDPSTNTWETLPGYPGPEFSKSFAFVIDGKMYIGASGEMWQFDPVSGWSSRTPYPGRADYDHAGFSVGPYGYVGAGTEETGFEEFTSTSDFWQYDPGTDVWVRKADVPVACNTPSSFSINGRGYLAWGSGLGKRTFEYDVAADRWAEQQRAPAWAGIFGSAVFVAGSKAYIGTGFNETSDLRNSFYVFDPGK